MIGRAMFGIAIGGFWAMSTAVVMRLLPEDSVPKGLAMINAGNAIAATISAPLGSLLGDYVGWRGAFFLVVPMALLALIWQWISLPSLPSRGRLQGVSITALSAILLLMGLAGVAGTWLTGLLLRTRLFSLLIVIPLVMALLAAALISLGTVPLGVTILLIGWGFFGTAAPVGWGT